MSELPAQEQGPAPWVPRRSLFRKYLMSFAAVVAVPLATYSAVTFWFTYREHRASLADIQKGNAEAAALRITQFLKEIEGHLSWATHLSWSEGSQEQHRLDAFRLLRQVPAITDLLLVDGNGRERLYVSRLSLDRAGSGQDLSADPRILGATANRLYYGPVYFRRETEPFMTLAVGGARREFGAVIAEVNLKHIWEVVSQIRVGRAGRAYVVDGQGLLVAHPDISLVLRKTYLSEALHRVAARDETIASDSPFSRGVIGLQGERVLVSQAQVAPLDWRVYVELPQAEADAPLFEAMLRALLITAGGLALAFVFALALASRMVNPIRALTAGAARIGAGRLDHRIFINTGDELERLGKQFNTMAIELEASYANLERKVTERTQELADANQSKSRFLAAASHDLRQPLHALNLLVGQLRTEAEPQRREHLAARIENAVANMNALFDGLLDISKLDAGVIAPALSDFPIHRLLEQVEAMFAADAMRKGLKLRVAPSRLWIRSDPALLERIVFNLVANAIRYTREGGVVVGVRRREERVNIEVIDTGIGIPAGKQTQIFSEFYQIAPSGSMRGDGLGLGLAIVERLCALLDHRIAMSSTLSIGSRFSVAVPRVPARPETAELAPVPAALVDPLRGKRIVVIDNDALVLESAGGLIRSWGGEVVTAASGREAHNRLAEARPDLVIADFHLADGENGVDAIALLRARFGSGIPAFIVSADIAEAPRRAAAAAGLRMLDKPVSPLKLRAMATQLLREG
ncbi:MAG: ATP-binding protein [Burkholderiales bacterium]